MTDVEPGPTKEGGLKDQNATPPPEDDSAEVDIETGEDADGPEGGGMIGEG